MNNQAIRLCAKSQSKNIPFFVIEFDLIDEQGRGLANAHVEPPEEIEREAREDDEQIREKLKAMNLPSTDGL